VTREGEEHEKCIERSKGAGRKMEMKLELVPVPVSDVDRAKAFYVEQVGFNADVDVRPGDTVRVVQLTPPGSACSIVIGAGLPSIEMQPGSLRGLHLVVADIHKAREALAGRGVKVSEVDEHERGVKYASFSDPDGNTWALQEMPWRSSEF
jgi:predicted enzyme related to lactoylglutathione lyase